MYDTIYAMVDRDDDLKIGVKSTAIYFGKADVLIVNLIQFVALLLWIVIGLLENMGIFYYLGFALACLFTLYQHHLIRDRDRQKCFQAFLKNNYFSLVIFAGVALHYL